MESLKRLVNSRRFMTLLPWVSVLILLIGTGAFLGTRYSNTAKVESSEPTGPPVKPEKPQKNIPFPDEAWQVAREFVFTAVARKKLAESYALVAGDSDVNGGLTLAEWKTGEITVPFIPVAQVRKYNWRNTNYAHPTDAQINVMIIPKRSAKQRTYYAQIGLAKVGQGSDAHWLVNYFNMLHSVPVPIG